MELTERHISNETAARAVRQALAAVPGELVRREAMAQTGSSGSAQINGQYDAAGAFVPYLRLDIDDMDSGRGCAP